MTLGEFFKQKRESSKLNFEQVSSSTKVGERQLRRIERNERLPSLKLLYCLCSLYKMSADEIKNFFIQEQTH